MGSNSKEYMSKYGRQWRAANPEKCRQYSREYAKRYRAKVSEKHRYWLMLKKYGMTKNDYADMLEAQNGVCLICQGPPDKKKSFHIDHDHATGRVRGLLCSACNTLIGLAKENIKTLQAAITYLRIFNESD